MFSGIEMRSGHLGGHGHTDDVAGTLAERASGGFDADRFAELWVTRGLGVQLAEVLNFLEREVEAGQVNPAVDEHGTMTGGEHEAVAVNPLRGRGVVAEEVAVKDGADFGGTEWQAEVARVASGHGIHGKATGFGGGAGKVGGIIERHGPYP